MPDVLEIAAYSALQAVNPGHTELTILFVLYPPDGWAVQIVEAN